MHTLFFRLHQGKTAPPLKKQVFLWVCFHLYLFQFFPPASQRAPSLAHCCFFHAALNIPVHTQDWQLALSVHLQPGEHKKCIITSDSAESQHMAIFRLTRGRMLPQIADTSKAPTLKSNCKFSLHSIRPIIFNALLKSVHQCLTRTSALVNLFLLWMKIHFSFQPFRGQHLKDLRDRCNGATAGCQSRPATDSDSS